MRPSKLWPRHDPVVVSAVAVRFALGVGPGLPRAGPVLETLIGPVQAVLVCVTFLAIPSSVTGGRFGTDGSCSPPLA